MADKDLLSPDSRMVAAVMFPLMGYFQPHNINLLARVFIAAQNGYNLLSGDIEKIIWHAIDEMIAAGFAMRLVDDGKQGFKIKHMPSELMAEIVMIEHYEARRPSVQQVANAFYVIMVGG